MLLFIFKFLLTNLIFSSIVCSLLIKFNHEKRYFTPELFLYSLGLGPAFTTLILYHAFLFFPGHSNIFYLALISIIYLTMAGVGFNSAGVLCNEIITGFKTKLQVWRESRYKRFELILLSLLIGVPLALYLYLYFAKFLPQPLTGHDVLIYGTAGKILFGAKSLTPIWVADFAESGFIYKILHAPSFSLLRTWEELINGLFSVKSDLYFKSISAYYGLLIIGVQFYVVSKKDKWLAVAAMAALLSGFAFFLIFFTRHIDSYRIFFIGVSWICLMRSLMWEDRLSFVMLGVFSGFSAFSHRIGLVFALINVLAFLIMMKNTLWARMWHGAVIVLCILACGGDHYVFDLIWGQGGWLKLK